MKKICIQYILFLIIACSTMSFSQTLFRATLLPDSVTQTTAILKGYYISSDTDWKAGFTFGRTLQYELTGSVTNYHNGQYCTYTTIKSHDTTFVTCHLQNLIPQTQWHYQIELQRFIQHSEYQHRIGNSQTFTTLPDSTAGGFIVPIGIVYPPSADFHASLRGFGVHTHASSCIDYSLGELEEPPIPPLGIHDLRFIPYKSTMANCIGQGLFVDIREYNNPMQIDTFKIKFQTKFEITPVVLEWGNPNNQYAGEVRLLFPLDGSLVNIDMKTQSRDTIPEDISSLYIIAEKPINLLSSWFVQVFSNTARVKGIYNPAGVSTTAWFEAGTTTEYNYETIHQNIGSSIEPVTFESEIGELLPNTTYHYRVVTQNINGISYGIDQTFETSSITGGINDEPILPQRFSLSQNYPNPFNPVTVFRYQLTENSHVTLNIYDVLGRKVATLIDGAQDAGYKTLEWNASNMPSGVYYYKLTAYQTDGSKTFTDTKKLLLVK